MAGWKDERLTVERRRAQQSGVSVWWPAVLRPTLTVQSVPSEAVFGAADNPEC